MMKKMIAILRGLLFVPALLFSLGTPARAELSLESTHGSGEYAQNALSGDFNATKKVNIGLGYSQYTSEEAPDPVKSYSGSVGVTLGEHGGVRGSLSNSPEVNGSKSSGWGASATYGRWSEVLGWTAGLACNQTYLSQYWETVTTIQRLNGKNQRTTTTVSSGWSHLLQTSLTPSLYADFLDSRVSFSCGYSVFSYDRNVAAFSDELSRLADPVQTDTRNNATSTSTDFGNLSSVISGFPSQVLSAGASVCPFRQLRLGYDWSETAYAIDKPAVNTSTFNIAYTFFSVLRTRLAYSLLSTDETYVSLGMQVLW